MTKIRQKIYLGHEYDAHMDTVNRCGITAILNVANDLNDPLYPIYKVLTFKIGLSDDKMNSYSTIALAIYTLKYLVDEGHIVLIHCRAGMSRSPHVLALYLSKVENKTYGQVWDEIRKLRPEILDKSKLL